jgi:hypothetical protein
MPTQETKILDNIIASRRALLLGGGAALAAIAMPKAASAASTVTTFSDTDILNFALNLEYLEANFYYLAAFGTNISTANPLYPTGAMVQGITGTGTQGTVTVKASPKVPFATLQVASYAVETAIEEGKHVAFLRSTLGNLAVAQPQIDLMTSFNTLASVAGIGPAFDPFASDANFLIGAYIFEDVGVTAYHGAAPLISTTSTGKTYLAAAAGILAVEAYHAGLVRTTINALDPTNSLGYQTLTQKISTVRATLAQAAAPTPASPFDANPDDYRLTRRRRDRSSNSNRRRRSYQCHCLLPHHHPGAQHCHRRKCNYFRHKSPGSLLPQRSQRPVLVNLTARFAFLPSLARAQRSARAFSFRSTLRTLLHAVSSEWHRYTTPTIPEWSIDRRAYSSSPHSELQPNKPPHPSRSVSAIALFLAPRTPLPTPPETR